MERQIKEIVASLIALLVEGEYSEIERKTNGARLSAEEIKTAVEQYGRKLVPPPSEAYDEMDVIEVKGSGVPQWSITMPLWTKEEGRSDLSVELTIFKKTEGVTVELDDIHVL